MYSHELGSTRAKYTVQLGQSNNFLYTVSYQQIKPWSLLSEGNQSKSWENVWANWNCLSLVTSHVFGTSRAEQTTSYMSYKQMKTLSLFTTRQPIQILKKVWPLFFLSLITFHAVSTTQGRAYNFLYVIISRGRLCHYSPQNNQSKSREKVWPLVLLSLGMVSMTPGNSLLLVYIRLGISSKGKKRMKIVPVCEAINSSRRVFSIQILGVMPSN